MKKNKKNISKATEQTFATISKMREDWGGISPVTKIIPNKKKNQKPKHKGRMWDE